jgi:hypothetical protein
LRALVQRPGTFLRGPIEPKVQVITLIEAIRMHFD